MASEIRVNQINSRTGVSTVSFTDSGPVISGVTTVQGSLNVTDGITGNLTGDVNAGVITATSSIVVGDKFINSSGVSLGTTDTAGRNAGVGTATGTLIYNSSTTTVEVYTGPSGWQSVRSSGSGIKATGGTITQVFGKTIHTFTATGSFIITDSSLTSVDYLVVAGGGGGGYFGGGGGAGGFRTGSGFSVSSTPGAYNITVGAGGEKCSDGTPSIFSTITSTGGGGGAPDAGGIQPGRSGGSGSGGRNSGTGGAGNTPPTSPPQGNPGGGSNSVANYAGGGGGGASQSGTDGAGSTAGNGGDGTASTISGLTVTYAGGGGGGGYGAVTAGSGGLGGGGIGGANYPTPLAGDGTTATGGGGGGGNNASPGPSIESSNTGRGGSGIVMIAYPT